jgi:hypothetical protein
MSKGAIAFWIAVALFVVGGVTLSFFVKQGPSNLDGFAQCLKEKGAVFYGQRTKALFGSAAKLLPYEECSTPDGKAQLPVCQEKGIESYPTWVFADGSRLTGERSLKELSEKTACALPVDEPGDN